MPTLLACLVTPAVAQSTLKYVPVITNYAGLAATVCTAATDTVGDGCPATQGVLGSNVSTSSSTGSKYAANGVFGVSVDIYSDVLVGDANTGLVRVVATGTNFGTIGSPRTNTLTVHFAAGDGPASSSPYVITTGASNFAVGTPGSCTKNADNSQDCSLPLTATPTVAGPTAGVLTVTSSANKVATFPLNLFSSPATTTKLTLAGTCSGSTTFASTTPLTFTATVSANGNLTGTVQFLDNGNALGSPVPLTVNGTTGTATLKQTFSIGNHSLTAVYSGDSTFTASSSSAYTFTTAVASFSVAAASTNAIAPIQRDTTLAGRQ